MSMNSFKTKIIVSLITVLKLYHGHPKLYQKVCFSKTFHDFNSSDNVFFFGTLKFKYVT